MADNELRKRLGAAAFLALDADLMDEIRARLALDPDEKASIPVTVKYVFSRDEEGEIEVATTARSTLPSAGIRITLKDDGRQLVLPGTTSAAAPEDVPQVTHNEMKQAHEMATNHLSEPASPGQMTRLEQISAENENLYRNGEITRQQAERAGVDVERVDLEMA